MESACPMRNILFISSLAPRLSAEVTQHAQVTDCVHVMDPQAPEAERLARIAAAEYLVLFPSVLDEVSIRTGTHLKLIQLVSAGFDRIDVALCRELGIPVANNGGTNAPDVAEHALMLMLAWQRRLVDFDRFVKAGQWRGLDSAQTTFTLAGKTVGIVGLGKIGQRVAQLLAPFGVRILFYDAYPPPPAVSAALGTEQVDRDTLLAQADIVTIHVPLNAATRNMIDAAALDRMKVTALLVNTCRGEVVDEAALVAALQAGAIGGAALDVLVQEPPLPDHPLLALDNIIFTPHTAGVTFDSFSRRGAFIFANIGRVADGQMAQALVN